MSANLPSGPICLFLLILPLPPLSPLSIDVGALSASNSGNALDSLDEPNWTKAPIVVWTDSPGCVRSKSVPTLFPYLALHGGALRKMSTLSQKHRTHSN